MTVQTGDVLEVVAKQTFDATEDVINVFQFQNSGGVINLDTDAVDDILSIMEAIYSIIVASQSILLLFQSVKIRNVTQSILMGDHLWPTLTAGTDAADAAAPGVSLVLNLGTLVPRVVLRKFFGGMTQDKVGSDGTFGAGIVVDALDIGALLLDPFIETNSTWIYGILSPKTSLFEVPVGALATNIPGYQRRRKQGRGS